MPSTLTAMPTRRCGTSDLTLPILGIGCWQFGGGEYWGAQSQGDVDAVVRHAVEHGCNFFDTAEAYNSGESERSLGLALRGIPREDVIVCTKISPSNTAPDRVVAHCDESLRRLGLDYVDLYMVHWPIAPHSIKHFTTDAVVPPTVSEAFAALDRLRRAGKIRHIGVSNFGRRQLTEVLATGVPIAVNELPYSLLTRAIELDILPFCRTNGIGVLGYMALLQGVLSDRYARLADLPEYRRRTRHFAATSTPKSRHGTAGAEAETETALAAIRAIARRERLSTSELSLKWAFAGEGITSSLCGNRSVAALKENIRAALAPLDPALVAELNRATQPLLDALGPSFDYYENPANDRTL
jgi:aryl-alcohol dehydrogenase-like predicted oxidoreductase